MFCRVCFMRVFFCLCSLTKICLCTAKNPLFQQTQLRTSTGDPVNVCCNMDLSYNNVTRWRRVAHLDFSNRNDSCALTLWSRYLDGFSLTRGNLAEHIWSFAAGPPPRFYKELSSTAGPIEFRACKDEGNAEGIYIRAIELYVQQRPKSQVEQTNLLQANIN